MKCYKAQPNRICKCYLDVLQGT